MKRRLFVSQLVAGCVLPLVPDYGIARAAPRSFYAGQSVNMLVNTVSGLVKQGQLGNLERLTIHHVYSPESADLSTLTEQANQLITLAGRLVGRNLSLDAETLFQKTSPLAFGSYSTRIDRDGLLVTWQALARIGRRAQASAGKLLVMGNKGVLQLDLEKMSYRLVDLNGRVVQADKSGFSLPV